MLKAILTVAAFLTLTMATAPPASAQELFVYVGQVDGECLNETTFPGVVEPVRRGDMISMPPYEPLGCCWRKVGSLDGKWGPLSIWGNSYVYPPKVVGSFIFRF